MAKPWQLIDVRKQTLKQANFQEYPKSTMRIQVPIDSRNSAIQHAYHILLHPSSSSQPRHPMLKIVVTQRVNTLETKRMQSANKAQRCPGTATGRHSIATTNLAMADIPENMRGGSTATHPRINSQHHIIVILSQMCKWSFRRFTYGNLVTTSPSSKW